MTKEQCYEDNSIINSTINSKIKNDIDSDNGIAVPKEYEMVKVPKFVVDSMKERLKVKSKELKELRSKHSEASQKVGHKNYQIDKLREEKKYLVAQCRDIQRRYETLHKKSKVVTVANTTLSKQNKVLKKNYLTDNDLKDTNNMLLAKLEGAKKLQKPLIK